MIKIIYKKLISEKKRIKINLFLKKVYGFFLYGTSYYCVCCEKYFRKFLKKGNGIEVRKNAVCPNCGSLERTRLLYLYLKNETVIFKNNPKILHIAPENCLKLFFKTNPNYFDIDLNSNFATYQMDITKISFEDSTFDFIICSHVLGHIYDELKAINELKRVLKSTGNLFILGLINPELEVTLEANLNESEKVKLEKYGEKDLFRLYGNDLKNRIENHFNTVEKIDYRKNFSSEEKNRFSLGNGKRELIFKCSL